MHATVAGGTGAGRRMHVRTTHKHVDGWACTCGHGNPSYAATCLAFGCRERRPK